MSWKFRNSYRAGTLVFIAAFSLAGFSQKTHVRKSQQPTSPVAPPPPAREIVRRAMQRDLSNWEQEKNYTFIQRIEQRELNAGGSVKSNKSETEEIVFLYDQPYAHLIKRNDQPLSDAEARKVEKKLNDTMEKRRTETPAEHEKRLAEFEKRHREEHEFLLEVPDAYDFRIVGEETLNGRAAYVISGEPRANFRPNLNAARVLPKLRPKLWIDKTEFQWLRMDADVIDTITWGGFLLRLHPGSHIEIEQTLVNNEVWLPLHARIGFDARVALVKPIRLDIDAVFSDYKKFRAESKIISVEEVQH
ncbi:MAG TPA: hypothetical protein VJR04_02190 [Terriglobales bacterium]|nr:hypothetical protein [Terriglobales bacterium]